MTAPAFRFANSSDVDTIVGLIESAYRSPSNAGAWDSESHLLTGPRTSHAEIARLIADPESRFIVAELDGRIAGCCLIQRRADTECMRSTGLPVSSAYFGMFAIDPTIRSAGLGKAVLAEAEHTVQRIWNASELVMTVINLRDRLIEWYQRRGYALTGHRLPFPFTEHSGETTRDFDLVEMKKALA